MKCIFLLCVTLLLHEISTGQHFHYLHDYDTTGDCGGNILLLPDNTILVHGNGLRYNTYFVQAEWWNISAGGSIIHSKQNIYTEGVHYWGSSSGAIKPVTNGGYVVPHTLQYATNDPDKFYNVISVLFLNAQLDTVALKKYTDTSIYAETARDLAILPDGSLLLAGHQTYSDVSLQDTSRGVLIYLDAQGNVLWEKTYQKEPGILTYMTSVQPLDNNRSLIGGSSTDIVPWGNWSYLRHKPWFVIINNSDGNILKDTLYTSGHAFGALVYSDVNGGYFQCGRKDSLVTNSVEDVENFPAYIAHLDTNFKINWLTSFPYSMEPYLKEIWRARQVQNGDYVICGHGQANTGDVLAWVARVNSINGAILWSNYYTSDADYQAYLTDFVERQDGSIILTGWTRNDTMPNWHGQDMWLVGLDANGDVLPHSTFAANVNVKSLTFSLYPNPAREAFTIEVEEDGIASLMDVTGRQLASYEVLKGKMTFTIPEGISPGNYLVQFKGKQSGMMASRQLVVR